MSAVEFVEKKNVVKLIAHFKENCLWTQLHYNEQNDSVLGYIFVDKTKFYSLCAGTL